MQAPLASQLEDLTNSLAPALAPIALVSEMVGSHVCTPYVYLRVASLAGHIEDIG